MASSYEVRQVAIKVKNIYNEINRRRVAVSTDALESPYWWKGAGSDAFSREYENISHDIKALLDVLDELERQLKTVATAIDEWEALAIAESEGQGQLSEGSGSI
jgi:uncharacterized protein YukE